MKKIIYAFCTVFAVICMAACTNNNENYESTKVTPRIILTEAETEPAGKPVLSENQTKFTNGITYEGKNGYWHIYGTPEKTCFVTLAGGTSVIPEWFESGKKLYISLNTDTAAKLVFRAFSDEAPDGVTLLSAQGSTVFEVPDMRGYRGLAIRLQVTGGSGEIDTVVHPIISDEPIYYGTPMLTIIDDDGDIHYLKDILPLCQEMNVNIASAVTTTRVGSSDRWMSWEDIKNCYNQGMEILCHTYSHPTPSELDDMSDEEIIERLNTAFTTLMEKNGIKTGDIIVYSSSTGYTERMRKAAEQIFKAGIVIGGNTVNTADSNPYNLKRYRIDFATGDGDQSKEDYCLEDMKAYIDTVSDSGGWEIWMFHTSNTKWRQLVEVNADGSIAYDSEGNVIPLCDDNGEPVLDEDGSQYELTVGHIVYVPMLKTAINYAQEKGVKIVTAEEGFSAYFDE
ncbi:MAG: polysaccharide deacetylase family protein [Oscillospiraceae bacterium]|nr:polysaccharide deacetylase family protein [Oscillospiraceae bacterium]